MSIFSVTERKVKKNDPDFYQTLNTTRILNELRYQRNIIEITLVLYLYTKYQTEKHEYI